MLDKQNTFALLLGILLCLGLWWAASLRFSDIVVPAPKKTALVAGALATDRAFWTDTVLPTLVRALLSGVIAAILGIGFGLLAGYARFINGMLEPLRLSLSAVPAPVFVILMLLWVGARDQTIVISVGILLAPLFFVATRDGLCGVDTRLMEMAKVYRFAWRHRLFLVVVPAIAVSLIPATRIAIANTLRLTILAEILVATGGFGEQISLSRQYLETEKLFALILLLVALIAGLDWFMSRVFPTGGRKP